MNNEIPDKQGLLALIKDAPSSSIPPERKPHEDEWQPPDINLQSREIWGKESNQLLDDYKFGESFAKFGESNLTTKMFLKRFSLAICTIISNEYQKRGVGAEEMLPLYKILESTFLLISKEIDKKDLKDFNILSIISSLQGFLNNYRKKGIK
ncbi:MAG: hypothetical protein PHS54_00630 [Clostridia bacterium]|nr:hypothetical protein [Clostridia bacterium]